MPSVFIRLNVQGFFVEVLVQMRGSVRRKKARTLLFSGQGDREVLRMRVSVTFLKSVKQQFALTDGTATESFHE
ncbi:hypothetical protein QQF64_029349 [Cirrhinus molitorella]|uniref:Uncharacterized protein n=1 Tax=Cirrhinus molitorella TaxID=172907 RepID=A0ABR3N9F5_9TELE